MVDGAHGTVWPVQALPAAVRPEAFSLAARAVRSGRPAAETGASGVPLAAWPLAAPVSAAIRASTDDKAGVGGALVLQGQPGQPWNASVQEALATLATHIGERLAWHRRQAAPTAPPPDMPPSEQQYRILFEHNPYPMWVAAVDSRKLLAVNRAAVLHYGYSEAEFLAMHVRDLWLDVDAAALDARWNRTATEEKVLAVPWRHRKKDGTAIDVEISSDAISFDHIAARLVLVHDVTQRRQAERELARVSRAQRLLSAGNEALVRAASEQALLDEICRVAVEIGGYSMAWVGFAEAEGGHEITAVAHAGTGADSMKGEPLSWDPEGPGGQGPAARTIRTGEAVIVEDLAQDPSFAPWLTQIMPNGFRGAASLPLRDGARTFGLFYLYAPDVVKIGGDEVRLLQQLADDMAFGIVHLRAQEGQRRLHAAVMKVAAAVSAGTGTAFFEQLARNMADALGAQAGFMVRFTAPKAAAPRTATTMAAVLHGQALPNFEFALAGTPCEQLATVDHCVVSPTLDGMFAGVPALAQLGAQTYVGRRLDNPAGDAVGLLFVLFDAPLVH